MSDRSIDIDGRGKVTSTPSFDRRLLHLHVKTKWKSSKVVTSVLVLNLTYNASLVPPRHQTHFPESVRVIPVIVDGLAFVQLSVQCF